MPSQTLMLFGGIGAILVLASLIGLILKLRTRGTPNAVIDNLNARIEGHAHNPHSSFGGIRHLISLPT